MRNFLLLPAFMICVSSCTVVHHKSAAAPAAAPAAAKTPVEAMQFKARFSHDSWENEDIPGVPTSTVFQRQALNRGFREELGNSELFFNTPESAYFIRIQSSSASAFPTWRTVASLATLFIIPNYEWRTFTYDIRVYAAEGTEIKRYRYELVNSSHFGMLMPLAKLLVVPFFADLRHDEPQYEPIGREMAITFLHDFRRDIDLGIYKAEYVGYPQNRPLTGRCASGNCMNGRGILRVDPDSLLIGSFNEGYPHGAAKIRSGTITFNGTFINGHITGDVELECSPEIKAMGKFSDGHALGAVTLMKKGKQRLLDPARWNKTFPFFSWQRICDVITFEKKESAKK